MGSSVPDAVAALLHTQDDVVARHQLVAAEVAAPEIRRLLRSHLTTVQPGVYVAHTGPLTWKQRAWVAVLHAWPAALQGESALRAAEGRADVRAVDDSPVHVMIAHGRLVRAAPGLVLHRRVHLDAQTSWNTSPPRQRYPEAVLDLAAEAASTTDRIAVLARGLQRRTTTAAHLRRALDARARWADRPWFTAVLDDLAQGACSVLEHGYLDRVERPHGLPPSRRQVREETSQGVVYRDTDNEYVVVELDGRAHHDTARGRDADMERDLDAAVDGRDTRRLTYGQVFDRPCATAAKLAVVMRRHGWPGSPTSCGPGCAVVTTDLAA